MQIWYTNTFHFPVDLHHNQITVTLTILERTQAQRLNTVFILGNQNLNVCFGEGHHLLPVSSHLWRNRAPGVRA